MYRPSASSESPVVLNSVILTRIPRAPNSSRTTTVSGGGTGNRTWLWGER